MDGPLKLTITAPGQAYVDQPSKSFMPRFLTKMEDAFASAFNLPKRRPFVAEYQRVRLMWKKPNKHERHG
jgi:hypothetical protein